MQDLGLLQYNFQVSLTAAVFLKPVTPIFFRSLSTLSIHLFLGSPTAQCHSGTTYFYTYIFPSALYSQTPSNCTQLQTTLSTKYRKLNTINPLMPNDPYSDRTAPLTSKRCILYIYSTNRGTEYFKHGINSPFSLFKMQFVS